MKKIIAFVFILSLAGFAVPAFAGPGLADGAAKFVGNLIQSNTAPGPNDTYTKLWNQTTAENGCKRGAVEVTRGSYSWAGCDAAYNWAKDNGGHFMFHTLLWGSQYPSWLESLSVEDTKKAITAWFDAVKEHYSDIEMIEVVSEAIRNDDGSYHSNFKETKIIEALGGDNSGDYAFITTAFKMARERWPDAILIYNDYNTIQKDRDRGINLINTIVRNHAPIDAYGLEGHDLQDWETSACLDYDAFVSAMEEIHDGTYNIPIFITEYDVATTDDNIQKQCFQEQISYWMEDPYVAGITLWGYIYGNTWVNCVDEKDENGKVIKSGKGCSGLVKDGVDRPAMTWLKDYLSKNRGVNESGLIGGFIEPEPQSPYGGVAWAIPGKIEAEDFDIPGKGRNADGTSNLSYNVVSSGHGNSDYRSGEDPNLYKNASGIVVGHNSVGNWYEYTVNVANSGTYTMFAAVASANNTSSFLLSMDGQYITEEISIPNASAGEENYSEYNKVSADVNLVKGSHILRLTVTGAWFDIDYMNFIAGADTPDPDPLVGPASSSSTVVPASSSSSGVAQQPFGGVASRIPGVIEAEDFDIPGIGSGNEAFYDVDDRNLGDSDYRIDLGVDLCERNSGIVVCRTEKDEWLEYTVNVTETGYYTFNASVSASAYGTGFRLKQGSSYITDFISVPYSEEEASSKFVNVKADLFLEAGTQTFRLVVMNGGFDIDYMIFVAQSSFGGVTAVKSPVENGMDLQEYDVFDMQGVRVERISANGMKNASSVVQNRLAARAGGVYLLRACKTGEMQTIRIAK